MPISSWVITFLLFLSFLLTGYFVRFHFLNRRQEVNKNLEKHLEILKSISNKEVKLEEKISDRDKEWAEDLYEINNNERELSQMKKEVKENIVYTKEEKEFELKN